MTQPQEKITQLPAAATFTGSELFELVQNNANVKGMLSSILALIPPPSGLLPITQQSGTSYQFVLGDAQTMVEFTNSSAISVVIPDNSTVAFPIGTTISIAQDNTGAVTVSSGIATTIKSYANLVSLAGRNAAATLLKTSTNTWRLFGTLA